MSPKIKSKPDWTEELARALAEEFLKEDSDGDEKLNREEFGTFLEKNGLERDQTDLAFAIFDNDKSGLLDFGEFVEFVLYQAIAEKYPRVYLARAFTAFDVDKNGILDSTELGRFLKLVGVEEPEEYTAAVIQASGGKPLTIDQLADILEIPSE
jgi:Ca2+-binding EF-hand superfamily protein